MVNLNFGKINPCVSFVVCLTTYFLALLCASASIYSVVLFLYVEELVRHSMSPAEVLHQVVFVLELEEGRYSDSEMFLLWTGLTGE